jgi:hypothetical protein
MTPLLFDGKASTCTSAMVATNLFLPRNSITLTRATISFATRAVEPEVVPNAALGNPDAVVGALIAKPSSMSLFQKR